MYDQGPKLGMRRKRNCAEDSATVKGKRPDFFLLSSRALLFKGEDKTSEAELEKALEDLSTKLKEWGAAVHGKVLQFIPPHCQVARHAQNCMHHCAKDHVHAKYHKCSEIWICTVCSVCKYGHSRFCFLFHCRWSTFCAMLAPARSSRCVPCD